MPARQSASAAGCRIGEPGHSKIEAAPEKVHWADFAAIPGTKFLEDVADGTECSVKSCDGIRIIRSRSHILGERHRIFQFIPATVKCGNAAEDFDHPDQVTVRIGNRHR